MACMEHNCTVCDWVTMDNRRGPSSCPKCGARVISFFDEDPDPGRPDEDEREGGSE